MGEDDFVCLSIVGIINFHIKNRVIEIENNFRAVKRAQKGITVKFEHYIEKIEIDIFDSL